MIDPAQELAAAREKTGISQAELARRAEMHQPAIARIERGGIDVSASRWLRLLDLCGCAVRIVRKRKK